MSRIFSIFPPHMDENAFFKEYLPSLSPERRLNFQFMYEAIWPLITEEGRNSAKNPFPIRFRIEKQDVLMKRVRLIAEDCDIFGGAFKRMSAETFRSIMRLPIVALMEFEVCVDFYAGQLERNDPQSYINFLGSIGFLCMEATSRNLQWYHLNIIKFAENQIHTKGAFPGYEVLRDFAEKNYPEIE